MLTVFECGSMQVSARSVNDADQHGQSLLVLLLTVVQREGLRHEEEGQAAQAAEEDHVPEDRGFLVHVRLEAVLPLFWPSS